MANLAMSHSDCTIWTIKEGGIARLSSGEWIDFATPQPVMAIAAGGASDDIYALQEDKTLLRLVRSEPSQLQSNAQYPIQEVSVGKDGTVCALIPQHVPYGSEFIPYVLRGGSFEYFGAPLASAISVVDQNEAWLVSKGRLVRVNPSGQGFEGFGDFEDAKWVSAASDGTVIVTTPSGMFFNSDPGNRGHWRQLGPLPPGTSWEGDSAYGPRVVCGSSKVIYASNVLILWKWNVAKATWNPVETGQRELWRISVASDSSVIGLSNEGLIRNTSFGWELLPMSYGTGYPAHIDMNNIWALRYFVECPYLNYWAGASWETLGKTPVTSISVGADGEMWGIDIEGRSATGDVYRRSEDGTWTKMKGDLRSIAVGSAKWVAAIDPKFAVRRWDPENQWSEPLPNRSRITVIYLGVGSDGTLMVSDNSVVRRWSGGAGADGEWVVASTDSVYGLQVIDANISCGWSGAGMWVTGLTVTV